LFPTENTEQKKPTEDTEFFLKISVISVGNPSGEKISYKIKRDSVLHSFIETDEVNHET